MPNNTVLVSHWKKTGDNNIPEKQINNETQKSKHESKPIVKSQKKEIVKPKVFPSMPIDGFFPEIMHTIKWRKDVIGKNFLNDFFTGYAFVYPILVRLRIFQYHFYLLFFFFLDTIC